MLSEPEWFKHLGKPAGASDVPWVFSDQRNLHSKPLVSRQPITILPGFGEGDRGVVSFDPRFLRFLGHLSDALSKEFPVDLDENEFVGSSGIHADFGKLKTVAGYSMTPMSLAPRDNAAFVESLGLPHEFRSARHAAIFDRFAHLVFSRWKPTSVKTAKLSTSGTPTWVSSARLKREHAAFLLANDRNVLRFWREKDLVGLAGYAKVVFMMNAGRRDQVDSVGRQREIFGLEYARSGGRRGKPSFADKRVFIDGNEVEGFSATRARLFHGGPYAANIYAQIIATGTMHGGLFEQFGPTFHCTDVPAMAATIGPDEDVRCSDATEYDRSMATFLIKRFFVVARGYWTPELIDWCEHLCFCAYFSRPVSLDVDDPNNRPVLMGDVFSAEDQVRRGNPSGHAWTSLIAKFMMTFDWLATVDDLTNDVLEDIPGYLNHQRPLKTLNNGDDGLYRGSRTLLKQYTDYRFGEVNPGYFVLKPEVGHVWSGYLMHRQPNGWFTAFQRLHTTFEKIFCPERSAGGAFRKQFTIGMIQRINHGSNPSHERAIEVMFKCWRDYAEVHFGGFMDMIMRHHERLDINVQELSAIDMAVLEKPELLHYKYKESDVSPMVISMLFEKALSPEEIAPFVERHYHGLVQ